MKQRVTGEPHLSSLHRRQHPAPLLLLPDESEHHDGEDQGLHLHRRLHGHQRRVGLPRVRLCGRRYPTYVEVFILFLRIAETC